MQPVGGLELIREFRQRDHTRYTYVIATSGSPEMREKAAEAGADMFMDKPRAFNDLWGQVATLFSQAPAAAS